MADVIPKACGYQLVWMTRQRRYVLTCNRIALHMYDPDEPDPMWHEALMGGGTVYRWEHEQEVVHES